MRVCGCVGCASLCVCVCVCVSVCGICVNLSNIGCPQSEQKLPAFGVVGCHLGARYNRMQQVREGFDTTFRYRISNPSVRCTFMDDVYTQCRQVMILVPVKCPSFGFLLVL
jgi:hypothetical protein